MIWVASKGKLVLLVWGPRDIVSPPGGSLVQSQDKASTGTVVIEAGRCSSHTFHTGLYWMIGRFLGHRALKQRKI